MALPRSEEAPDPSDTPEPTAAPTPDVPKAPSAGVEADSILAATVERPAPTDVMPEGELKRALKRYAGLTDFSYAATSTLTRLGNDSFPNPPISGVDPTGTEEWWTGIEFLPELRHLEFSGGRFASAPQEGLGPYVPKLDTLTIYAADVDLPLLGPLEQLTSLTYGNMGGELAGGMSAWAALYPRLENLYLGTISPEDSLTGLDSLPSLRTLTIDVFNGARSDFSGLSGSRTLEELSIVIGFGFTDGGFPTLDLPGLKSLRITAGLAQVPNLSGMPNLTSLNLQNNRFSRFPILRLPALESLDLSSNRIAEAAFTGDMQLSSLRTLNLSANGQLTRFLWPEAAPQLETLNLEATGIASLDNLSIEAGVESLDLRSSQLVSLNGLGRLTLVGAAQIGGENLWDFSAAGRYADLPTTIVVNQPSRGDVRRSIGDVGVGATQHIGSIIGLPAGSVVAIDESRSRRSRAGDEPNTFVVTDSGAFRVYVTVPPVGNISFHEIRIDGSGDASLPGASLKVEAPVEAVPVGESMRFTSTLAWSGEPQEVTRYQWYSFPADGLFEGLADATPLDGEVNSTMQAVNSKATGNRRYLLVAYVGELPMMSNIVRPAAFVDFSDQKLAECVLGYHGGPLTYEGLAKPPRRSSYDCSARGISSIEGLQYVHGTDRGIAGGAADQFDLSHNEISDLSPIASMESGQFGGIDIDLSYNKVSDATPLWSLDDPKWISRDLNGNRNSGFNLDHNQVSSLAGLASLKPAGPYDWNTAISFLQQDLRLPNARVSDKIGLPDIYGPDGKKVQFSSEEGVIADDGTISFSEPGVKTIRWEQIQAQYTRFSGTVTVTVGAAAEAGLTVEPEAPRAANLMTFTGDGFTPGELVKVTWNGEPLISVTANAIGIAWWSWREPEPSAQGEVTVVATGESSRRRADLSFTMSPDAVADVPDTGLRGCFLDALGLDADAVLYASLPRSLDGTLDCRGRGIKDLTGLDAFQPLNGAVLLNNNALSSLTTLPTMGRGVRRVDVSSNAITATGVMQPQPSAAVRAASNQITDFRQLQKVNPNPLGMALDQRIALPITLVGGVVSIPEVLVDDREPQPGLSMPYTTRYTLPEGAVQEDGGVRFTQLGTHQVGFVVYDEFASGMALASGSFEVTVVKPYDTILNIAPGTLLAGQLLNATGAGFTPGEKVLFTVGTAPQVVLGEAVADNRGVARITDAEVPKSLAPGAYQVGARGLTSGIEVSAPLTVRAPELPAKGLNVNPRELFPGQVLNAIGSGFAPGESVSFTLGAGGHLLGRTVANDRGVAGIANALVPPSTRVGNHTVVASGATSGVTVQTGLKVLAVERIPSQPTDSSGSQQGSKPAPWRPPALTTTHSPAPLAKSAAVTKVLNINPTRLYPGQLLNAIGAGFTPGEQVVLTLGEKGPSLSKAEASALGVASFTNVMVPPGTKPGEHAVVAKGLTSGMAVSTTLTVTSGQVPGQVLNINPGQLYAGQLLNAIGAGFAAGEQVTFTLGEGGRQLGSSTASERGIASITDALIPRDVPPGTYEIVAHGTSSGVVVRAKLSVQAVEQAAASIAEAPAAVPVVQPDTASAPVQPDAQGVVIALVALALFLVGLAGVMLVGRKR